MVEAWVRVQSPKHLFYLHPLKMLEHVAKINDMWVDSFFLCHKRYSASIIELLPLQPYNEKRK